MPGKKRTLPDDNRPIPMNYVREWRKHRRLTIEQLVERTGLSVATISDVETRKGDFTGKTLLQLAKALDTDPGSLLNRDPRRGDAVLEVWNELRPRQQSQALGYMQALKETPNSV